MLATYAPYSLSLLTNLLILQKKLDITLFPNVPSSVRVHSGFADSQANTAKVILNETKRLIASYQATTVTVVRRLLLDLASCC